MATKKRLKMRVLKAKQKKISEQEWWRINEVQLNFQIQLNQLKAELTDIRSMVANSETITNGEAWRASHNALCVVVERCRADVLRTTGELEFCRNRIRVLENPG